MDEGGVPRPVLAETLPQANTEAWHVSPDGRMETTYRLRPNLVWHDAHELSAEDFVFAWRVYTNPELGLAAQLTLDGIIRFPQGAVLLREWEVNRAGVVLLNPVQLRYSQIQYRPGILNPRAMSDYGSARPSPMLLTSSRSTRDCSRAGATLRIRCFRPRSTISL